MGLMTATVGAGLLGAGASIYGANKAAKASDRATQASIEEQRRQYDQSREDMSPFMQAGAGALGGVQNYLGLGPDGPQGEAAIYTPGWTFNEETFQAAPGFDWKVNRALDTVLAKGSGGGNRISGPMQESLLGTAMNLYSQEYDKERAWHTGRYDNLVGNYMNLAGSGQNAAAGLGALGANSAGQISNALMTNGANQGNAYLTGANQVTNLLGQGLGAYMYNQGKSGKVN